MTRRHSLSLAAPGAGRVAAALILTLAAGCGAEPGAPAAGAASDSTMPLAVRVVSDRGRSQVLDVRPPVRICMARVSPARQTDPARVPVPEPATELLPLESSPPALEVDPDLLPPILRTPASLELPRGRGKQLERVELDVRVDEHGNVSDALWAGGTDDSLLVSAAIASALGMHFYPALQAGRPVAVWCRQRYEFGR